MAWDDSDDDEPVLAMPGAGAPAAGDWSDEETEEEAAAAKQAARDEKTKGSVVHQEEKVRELTKLEIAIGEREKREIAEAKDAKAKKKAALAAKMAGGGSELEQELMDGGGDDFGGDEDGFEWDGGRGDGGIPDIDTSGLASALPRAGGEIEEFVAKKDADFTKLAGLMGAQIQKYDGKRGQLVLLKALLKQSTASLTTDDCKELNTMMGTIFNDKLKADREKDKGKPKKGAKKMTTTQGKAIGGDVGGRGGYDDYDDDDY
tara:strand:- start:1119 stop:1901 length:783 start_codon:yes stop_codon:yes gene_type:complete|eukprot:scaffold86253_cov66-Phaeocystis_antarctica.AAC.6